MVPAAGQRALHEVPLDGGVDAGLLLPVAGVPLAHAGQQPARRQLRRQRLRPLVRRRRVVRGADDEDRRRSLGASGAAPAPRPGSGQTLHDTAPQPMKSPSGGYSLPSRSASAPIACDAARLGVVEAVDGAVRGEVLAVVAAARRGSGTRRPGAAAASRRRASACAIARLSLGHSCASYMPRARPVAIRAWVRGRPLAVRSGVSSVRASRLSSWPYASSTVPRSGQPSFARQSFTYDRTAREKPSACPSAYCADVREGSTAPSSTRRPTRQGNSWAYQAPQVGAVGGAVVGEDLVAEHRAQHVHVVHRADRVEVGERRARSGSGTPARRPWTRPPGSAPRRECRGWRRRSRARRAAGRSGTSPARSPRCPAGPTRPGRTHHATRHCRTSAAASLTQSAPPTPGPPGFTSSEPIRLPVAAFRETASCRVPPAGFDQSTGTVTLVHVNPPPQSVQVGFCP